MVAACLNDPCSPRFKSPPRSSRMDTSNLFRLLGSRRAERASLKAGRERSRAETASRANGEVTILRETRQEQSEIACLYRLSHLPAASRGEKRRGKTMTRRAIIHPRYARDGNSRAWLEMRLEISGKLFLVLGNAWIEKDYAADNAARF